MSFQADLEYEGTARTAATTTIEVSWSEWVDGSHDLVRLAGGSMEAASLVDAVLVSLLSWRRAREGDPVPAGAPREGWWADAEFGSRLWLLASAKATPQTVRLAQDYASEALAWLVADGVASSVAVEAERQGKRLALRVRIARPSAPALLIRFADLWEAL